MRQDTSRLLVAVESIPTRSGILSARLLTLPGVDPDVALIKEKGDEDGGIALLHPVISTWFGVIRMGFRWDQRRASSQPIEVLLARQHCVDEHLVAAVEDQHSQLQQPTVRVKAESELGDGRLLCLRRAVDGMLGGVVRVVRVDPMLER